MAFTKKILSLQTDIELFESMSNMVIINSLPFPYPLPVLMRVLYKLLIVNKIPRAITNIRIIIISTPGRKKLQRGDNGNNKGEQRKYQ